MARVGTKARAFETSIPMVGFLASLIGAAVITIGVFRADEGFAVLLLVMAGMWLTIEMQRVSLKKHHELLSWFVDHVYSADEVKGRTSDAPQELKDLVNKE